MTGVLHKFHDTAHPHLRHFFQWIRGAHKEPTAQNHIPKAVRDDPEKQQALRSLCEQLFKKKALLTSGQIQLIGLENIKRRMGRRWDGLCAVVYETANDVIREYLEESDLFIRYTDETYVIIFAHAGLDEGRAKSALIAEEIRRRLFLLDEEDLREIEIKKSVRRIKTDSFSNADFSDLLGDFIENAPNPVKNPVFNEHQDNQPFTIGKIKVESGDYRPEYKRSAGNDAPLAFSYTPLWDVKRDALTAYLCLATRHDTHKAVYKDKSADERANIDLQALSFVTQEIAVMATEQKKFLVACPVSYETLFGFESYERYREQLHAIPAEQRQFLVLFILKPEPALNAKDAYWFIHPLREKCRAFFAEVPLKHGVNFQALRNAGIDGVGLFLDGSATEQHAMSVLSQMSANAKSCKIPYSFILGVPSLSLATASVCAGFDYIGGPAIGRATPKPDSVQGYGYDDMVSAFLKK